MDPRARIDIPMLVRSLKTQDEVMAQNAGALLGFYACHNEEHREAIAAQQENIFEILVQHLTSGKNGLAHNAALLLGQCLMISTEFRQAFGSHEPGPRALVSALRDDDNGVVCNVTWAMRHFVSDPKCHLSPDLAGQTESLLPSLLMHKDARIKVHGTALQYLLLGRKELEREEVKAKENNCLKAIEALTSLAAAVDTTIPTTVSFDELACDESSPTGGQQSKVLSAGSPSKGSPKRVHGGRRNQSMIAPWKKVMAFKYSAVKAAPAKRINQSVQAAAG